MGISRKILSERKTWLLVAIGNFFLAACIGAFLRFAFVVEVPGINYRNVLHGHSHVAMLGWLYMGFFIFFISAFLPHHLQQKSIYRRLFWLTEMTVIGMLISFPIQGYAGASIVFSTLHILLSYVFVYQFLTDTREDPRTPANLFAKTALGFMVLSTLGLWGMPPIMIQGLQGQPIFYLAVQFFLHFQFNGWFIFAVFALFFSFLETKQVPISPRLFRSFYVALLTSCVLSYALYIAWSYPESYLFVINSLSVLIQLATLVFFLKFLSVQRQALGTVFSTWNRSLLVLALFSFIVKVAFQTIIVVPYMAIIGYTIRNFVIGFFHLLLLGMVSSFLLAYADSEKLLDNHSPLKQWAIRLFVVGFILSELILFLQGSMFWAAKGFMPYYYELLFATSLLLPLGIGGIGLSQRLRERSAKMHNGK